MGARETPSPRGDYASPMCSRSSELAIVRYRTQLPSCGGNDRNQHRKRSGSCGFTAGCAVWALHLDDVGGVADGRIRGTLAKKAGRNGPAMPVIGNDCDRLLVVSRDNSPNDLVILCLKPDLFADLEPQHLHMCAHLLDHAQP